MESLSVVKNEAGALSLLQITSMHQGDAHWPYNYQECQSILLNSIKKAIRYRLQLTHQLALLCETCHRMDLQSRSTERLTEVRRC